MSKVRAIRRLEGNPDFVIMTDLSSGLWVSPGSWDF